MRTKITEPTILFLSIIKWVVLATLVGVVVGAATSGFLLLLGWSTSASRQNPYWFWILPAAMFVSSLLVTLIAPEAEGHGTEKVIEAVHKRDGHIPVLVVPVKLVATILTLAFGGSVGKEGPCAQIGAGLTSLFSDLLRFDTNDRKKLVICGISAGFAAVFGTPIAGSIFGVEVLVVGAILYDVLLPSFIAGVIAFQVSSAFGITYFHEPVGLVPVFSESFLLKVIAAGVFFGLCSILLIEVLRLGDKLSARMRLWKPLKGVLGGLALVGLSYVFSVRYFGLGLETIETCLRGGATDWYAFLVKPLFTSITLGFGGSGGIVTPIFFIGAAAGSFFAHMTGLNAATFSAIGLVSVLAGAANTPIAASIMAVEMFGPAVAPYATISCVVSFLLTGHRSVYPSQVLSISKSSSLQVELGKELEAVETTYRFKPHKSLQYVLERLKRIELLVRRYRDRNDQPTPARDAGSPEGESKDPGSPVNR